MSLDSKFAAEVRACVLELGKIPTASRYADRMFRLCQRLTSVADMMVGDVEFIPPAPPAPRRDMREAFRRGTVNGRNGNVVKVDFKARRKA